jgi:hypothetical protein
MLLPSIETTPPQILVTSLITSGHISSIVSLYLLEYINIDSSLLTECQSQRCFIKVSSKCTRYRVGRNFQQTRFLNSFYRRSHHYPLLYLKCCHLLGKIGFHASFRLNVAVYPAFILRFEK